jgi:hypothetical protein
MRRRKRPRMEHFVYGIHPSAVDATRVRCTKAHRRAASSKRKLRHIRLWVVVGEPLALECAPLLLSGFG